MKAMLTTSEQVREMDAVERRTAIVVGGGQAGLSTAYELRRLGVDCLVLEAQPRLGDQWRRRWDSLELFTPARLNSLPGFRFPAPDMTYPTKDQMADFLESYAVTTSLPVRTGARALALRHADDGYVIDTTAGPLLAGHVVIATGSTRPRVPSLASELAPSISQLHAYDYRNSTQLRGEVLVVGAGTSGVEIAVEAAKAGHPTTLSGRGTGEIPRIAYDALGGRVFWFFANRIASVRTPIGRRMRQQLIKHGAPLIRWTMADAIAAGVERRPRVAAARDGMPVFEDETVAKPHTIVWCTGFRHDYSWIQFGIPEEDSLPRQCDGVIEGERALYVVGLPFQTRLASALIGGAGADARLVARAIASRLSTDSHVRLDEALVSWGRVLMEISDARQFPQATGRMLLIEHAGGVCCWRAPRRGATSDLGRCRRRAGDQASA